MRFLVIPARQDTPEMLDDPQSALPDLAANLQDIRRLNRWFGGTAIALRQARAVLRESHGGPGNVRDSRASLLDVAAGSGDFALAAWRWGERTGLPLEVTALDLSAEVLAEARQVVEEAPVRLVQGDARTLPWPDASFDLVTCCLAIHHFPPAEAQRVLAEMWRVARSAAVVVDLRRSYAAYAGVWLATRTVSRNRMTRHDGPLSVLRAYTPDELHRMVVDAGWKEPTLRRHALYRQSLLGRKGCPGPSSDAR